MPRFLLYADSVVFANRLISRLAIDKIHGVFVKKVESIQKQLLRKDIELAIYCVDGDQSILQQNLDLFHPALKKIVILWHSAVTNRYLFWKSGADDVIEYPCSEEELLIRIKRQLQPQDISIRLFAARYYPVLGELRQNDIKIVLSQLERRLLNCLLSVRENFCTRETLVERVWPVGIFASGDALDVLIRRLRLKLKPCHITVIARRGYGYKLSESLTDKTV